jgi:RimJ/RimL family protein N-acetyltransferase
MQLISRKINKSLFEDYYRLKCDPVNIAWTGFEHPPEKDTLQIWFEIQINNEKRDIFLFYDEINSCVGYCYFDYIDNKTFEESIGVYSQFSGQGIATAITNFEIEFAQNHGYTQIKSWISEQNTASIKRVIKNGFIKSSLYEIRKLPLLGGEHKFYKYVKHIIYDEK